MALRWATGISGSDSTKGQLLDRQCRPASSSMGRRYAMAARSLQGMVSAASEPGTVQPSGARWLGQATRLRVQAAGTHSLSFVWVAPYIWVSMMLRTCKHRGARHQHSGERASSDAVVHCL